MERRKYVSEVSQLHQHLDNDKDAVETLVSGARGSFEQAIGMVMGWIKELSCRKGEVRGSDLTYITKERLEKILDNRIEKANELLKKLKELNLEVSLSSDKLTVQSYSQLRLSFKNDVPLPCSVSVELEPSDSIDVNPRQAFLKLEPFATSHIDIQARPRRGGLHQVDVKVRTRWLDEIRSFSNSFTVEATARPEVRVGVRAPSEITEGEELRVEILLTNTGETPVEAKVTNPFNGEVRESLSVGEKKTVLLRGTLSPGKHILPLQVEYLDDLGNKYRVEVPHLEVHVKHKGRELPKEVGESKEVGGVALDVDELTEVISKHALAFLTGLLMGKLVPEKKRFEKPVYVQDVPYIQNEGVTVILEDPAAVIVEDAVSYIKVRPAKLTEILSSISGKAAKRLTSDFKSMCEAALQNWSPSIEDLGVYERGPLDHTSFGKEVTLIETRFKDLTEKQLKELLRETKDRGLGEENVRDLLPTNFTLEFTYGRRGAVRTRPSLKVYVGAFSRIKNLLLYGVDREPLSLGDALKGLELEDDYRKPSEYAKIFVLASPTGWTHEATKGAEKLSANIRLILIDLKRDIVHYNKSDELAKSLVKKLGYEEQPQPIFGGVLDEKLEELDAALLDGEIDQATYCYRLGL